MANEKGFTLLEVIVSITLATIVLISFFTFFIQSSIFSSVNDQKLKAINLSRKYIGQSSQLIQSTGISDLCTNPPKKVPDYIGCYKLTEQPNFPSYLFIMKKNSQNQLYPVLSRVYYGNHYVDTYTFYDDSQ